ncbi:hypothetical protein ACPYO6_06305 [Georgenia sp. Z1344]|uniref:hypothetical protein n=1 Tax=Georgenia sp. Z1344 TaxID=3416706 RepID=UPI003CF9C340
MYAAIFRALPGPRWLRAVLMAVLILAAVAALFVWVFPWVESMLPSADLTVE